MVRLSERGGRDGLHIREATVYDRDVHMMGAGRGVGGAFFRRGGFFFPV